MSLQFTKATKTQARLRMALIGPAGSGKSLTALKIARALVGTDGHICALDTERRSLSLYADQVTFDVLELETFAPQTYVDAIHAADEAGADALVIDSLSHAWMGKGGALEQVDNAAKRSRSHNSWAAWREVTPEHNKLVDAILSARCHVLCTMRTKTEWVQEKDEKTGKIVPVKIGLQPVQRDGLDYEFTITADLDLNNNLIVDKTRCSALKGKVFHQAGEDIASILLAWLRDGAAPPVADGAGAPNPTPPVPDPVPPGPITKDQLKRIQEHAQAAGHSRESILEWLKVEKLTDIKGADFDAILLRLDNVTPLSEPVPGLMRDEEIPFDWGENNTDAVGDR